MWIYRIKYAKMGRIRFISHLDVMRAILRAINRANIPVAYTEGFNPRPKISMGPALPLGYESNCELADMFLAHMLSPPVLHRRLGAVMPRGLDLLETGWVLGSSPRLSAASSARYMIELPERETAGDPDKLVQEFLASESVPFERVRKDATGVVDIRQLVRDLAVRVGENRRWLEAEIAIGVQGSCSPAEVVQSVLKLDSNRAKCLRIMRTDIRFDGRAPRVKTDGKIQEKDS